MNLYVTLARAGGTALLLAALSGCAERSPIELGFVAGISGRVADLGIGGRNGAMLAVEQRNLAGGIDGRPVELIIRDDEQNAATARRVTQELIDRKVAAIIGPMTSSMCAAILPQVDEARVVMMSPTCTSTMFSDRDDHFLRIISATKTYAEKSADHQFHALKRRKIAAIYDVGNRAYTESWLNDFRARFQTLGGQIVREVDFTSSAEAPFPALAEQLLSAQPDAILIVTNSVDAAMLAQHLHRIKSQIPLLSAEWAATERLIELGGPAVEGLEVAQFIDRQSRDPDYQAFAAAFRSRFNQEPGFAGVLGYDATRVVLETLANRRTGHTLKADILATRSFKGTGGSIEFNALGDAQRTTYLTEVRNQQFQTLE
jgi:branched-chain amino acid transport system substrate-binding protein